MSPFLADAADNRGALFWATVPNVSERQAFFQASHFQPSLQQKDVRPNPA